MNDLDQLREDIADDIYEYGREAINDATTFHAPIPDLAAAMAGVDRLIAEVRRLREQTNAA